MIKQRYGRMDLIYQEDSNYPTDSSPDLDLRLHRNNGGSKKKLSNIQFFIYLGNFVHSNKWLEQISKLFYTVCNCSL
ncbi:hypothetical protein BpHYR1_014052 [Brachionus plicatilis]|uniref:Uncharacterized protein n=1 Tax=Brachionus plicatilis TaxID=10195 RepID=A0A3M7T6Q6_BRAPC|nr:hypothetical protein BpHYR1_014052 [Brachionus plicatilis]